MRPKHFTLTGAKAAGEATLQGERGGVVCPFESLHIDMQMRAAA